MRRRAAFLSPTSPILLATAFAVLVAAGVTASERPGYFDRPAEVIPPVRYNRNRRYPVFVLLPPTGAHASDVARNFGLDPAAQEEFLLVFPAGRPTRDEYLPNFGAFVGWYEERLLADLETLFRAYNADPDRVYLGGYSLGGDLSWALAVRNPGLFAGAVIAGSRTSHPVEETALLVLRDRDFRAAFLIGNREDPLRYRGINIARGYFEERDVPHIYEEYRGAHVIPPSPTLRSAVEYVTQVERLPDPAETPRVAAPLGGTGIDHVSRDRLALRLYAPGEVSGRGLTAPTDTEVGARVEWPWERLYLRTTVAHETTTVSTDEQLRRLRQDVLVAASRDARHFLGLGFGWDWLTDVTVGRTDTSGGRRVDAYRTFDVLLAYGVRNPWIIPASRVDGQRIDSLLLLRYAIPRGLGSGAGVEHALNLEAEYLLRIGDRFAIDATAGSSTVQNRPADPDDTIDSLSAPPSSTSWSPGDPAILDHRLEWEVGVGVRAPSPFLWRIGYRGRAERPLEGGSRETTGFWLASIEYSY